MVTIRHFVYRTTNGVSEFGNQRALPDSIRLMFVSHSTLVIGVAND